MTVYLMRASGFFLLCILFTCISGLPTMEDSYPVGSSNLTNDSVGSSKKIGQACANEGIIVNQGASSPMPNGRPTYTVEIVNVCMTGCSIAEIHLSCGWFSSAVQIDPKLFRRLKYNDCLVNNGDPIKAGGSVSFEYSQTYKFPMAVSSVKCVP